jgi:dTDP-4-amino-4,6-dideoxygalactose transaminase
MQIPFHRPYITDSEIEAVTKCLKNGWLTMGKKTVEFENKLGEYLGTRESVAVNSCTAALHLALRCIGLKPGDEVIVPTMTHSSTAEVVGYFGSKPVMVDIEKETHLIDVSDIEKKITKKTKAIIPVHYAGQPADMDEIMTLAEKNNLYVIEDAAHALPAKYKNRFIGTVGDITCFSFYATKTLTTGEGGLATTKNREWADLMRLLRLHGVSKDAWGREKTTNSWEYDVVGVGYKYNTTDINTVIGIEQLKKIDFMNNERHKIASMYNNALKRNDAVFLYKVKDDRETSWHLYPLKLNLERLSIDRNDFINELKARKIATSVHFIPMNRFTYYKNLGYSAGETPNSEWVFERTLSLPIFPGMTDKEINYVIENVLDLLDKYNR